MFGLLDRIPNGVEPMLTDIESYIKQSGVDDMKACAEIITTVREGACVMWVIIKEGWLYGELPLI